MTAALVVISGASAYFVRQQVQANWNQAAVAQQQLDLAAASARQARIDGRAKLAIFYAALSYPAEKGGVPEVILGVVNLGRSAATSVDRQFTVYHGKTDVLSLQMNEPRDWESQGPRQSDSTIEPGIRKRLTVSLMGREYVEFLEEDGSDVRFTGFLDYDTADGPYRTRFCYTPEHRHRSSTLLECDKGNETVKVQKGNAAQ